MSKLDTPLLCFVTDRKRCLGRDLEEVVEQAVAHGAGMVQLREKDLSARDLFELGTRVQNAIAGRAKLIVNDRVDVALALNADGVQLPEDGNSLWRTPGGSSSPNLLIGRSVHSVNGAVEAQSDGADFLIAGTIFPSPSHPDSPRQEVDFLRALCREVSLSYPRHRWCDLPERSARSWKPDAPVSRSSRHHLGGGRPRCRCQFPSQLR